MERKIVLEVRLLRQMIKHKIQEDRKKKQIELTHGQIRVLLYINKQDKSVYQKDIEELLHIRRSTATEMLNVLERDGYIIRKQAHHDRRLKEIHITPKARKAVKQFKGYVDKFEKKLIKNIEEEDLQIFFKVFDQIKENIE